MAVLLSFAGCSDEIGLDRKEQNISSEYVSFSAAVSVADNLSTRSAEYEPYDPLVLNGEKEDFPLYLHTYEHPLGDEGDSGVSDATRGLEVESAKDLYGIHKSFAVKGDLNGAPYITMQNTKTVGDSDDRRIWTTVSTQRWPGNEYLAFNAIAPFDHLEKIENPEYGENKISFSYTAQKGDGSNDAEVQTDLLVAAATMNREEAKEYNHRVPLRFNHALSAIKFAVRDVLKGRVVSIAIKGINSKGYCEFTADPNSENGKFVWSNQSGIEAGSYTQIFNHEIEDGNFDTTDDSKDVVLTDQMPEKTFMVIPQTIPDDAVIEVVIERDNVVAGLQNRITVRGKIKANELTEWLPGHEYIYTISTSKDNWVYVFDAEGNEAEGTGNIYVYSPSDPEFQTYDNTAYFNVKSYRYKANNQNYVEALPWKASHGGSNSFWAEGASETAYPPANPSIKYVTADQWITDNSKDQLSGAGKNMVSNPWEKHDLSFLPHFITTDYIGDGDMQGYQPYEGYDESKPYDLSTFGETRARTTANCYVVDRGGWYMFPLVYGNAIKNGVDTKSAYQYNYTQSNANFRILSNFTDYQGNAISNAYINGGTRAELVWQDAYGLIDNLDIITVNGVRMIRFYIESNDLQQGNAIIALTDGSGRVGESNIIWSWHIWATDHWLSPTTGLPHVYNATNAEFTSFKANYKTGMRDRGDVAVTYRQHNRTFMMSPYNLGWCDPKKVVYLKRKSNMEFVQYMPDGSVKTGKTDNLPIIQQGSVVDYKHSNNTYYQFGRKDPMRGYFNLENATKVVFGPRQPKIKPQNTTTLKDGIREPEVYFAGNGTRTDLALTDWVQNYGHSNLWNNSQNLGISTIANNDNDNANLWSHVKTIYDPCPQGYMVPNAGVFRMVAKTGNNSHTGLTSKNKSEFTANLNGELIDEYTIKIWGNGVAGDNNAIYFASTGHRWWTDYYTPTFAYKTGDNYNKTMSYAWSNRYVGATNSQFGYCLAVGYDDNESEYTIASHFIGRRIMARAVRPIQEP